MTVITLGGIVLPPVDSVVLPTGVKVASLDEKMNKIFIYNDPMAVPSSAGAEEGRLSLS